MKKFLTLLFFIVFFVSKNYSQNVGINATGAVPNTSAMLDVASPSLGVLVPRVSLTSTTDVVTVPTPATSLLVYNQNAAMTGGGLGYYWWNGTIWVSFNQQFNQTYVTYSSAAVVTSAVVTLIPGMSITATVPAGMTGKFIIRCDVGLAANASQPSGTDVSIYTNGAWVAGSAGYKRLYLAAGNSSSYNIFGNAVMQTVQILPAGTHTFEVYCWKQFTGAGVGSATVGGASGSVLQSCLTVEMFLQ